MAGLTIEQSQLLEQRYCRQGHRFDGVNYPTPDGVCPLCAWPDFRADIDRFQWLLLSEDRQSQPRASLHPSLTAM